MARMMPREVMNINRDEIVYELSDEEIKEIEKITNEDLKQHIKNIIKKGKEFIMYTEKKYNAEHLGGYKFRFPNGSMMHFDPKFIK